MTVPRAHHSFDYILVGGGLQAGLIVMALRHHQPDSSILVIEQQSDLAGNHTWSFHPEDVPSSARSWVDPLIEHQWNGYDVRLKGFRKRIDLVYASISSRHFADVISRKFPARRLAAAGNVEADTPASGRCQGLETESADLHAGSDDPGGELLLGKSAVAVSADSVRVDSGEVYHAKLVVDCRGPGHRDHPVFSLCGYQKFWGFEIETVVDWPSREPVIMDDAVDQTDGFRFVYSLPFEPRRILVEDTRFSDSPTLDRIECHRTVSDYLSKMGIDRWRIRREESGVLPMPISSELLPGSATRLAGGYAGGWFHAATGYSFPLAVALAESIATSTPETAEEAIADLAAVHRSRSLYGRFLNRLLFCLVTPKTRYQIFRRFYSVLSREAIARFYSHQFTARDAARIVIGIPPRGLRPIRFLKSFSKHQASTNPLASILHSETV